MNTLIKGKSLRFDDQYLVVELDDGRIIATPMSWYPELLQMSPKQRAKWNFFARGVGIEWPELDYQLSIESMLLGGVPLRVQRAKVTH